MRYIGDVHGHIKEYLQILDGCDQSIQVGDFGAGFVPLPTMPLEHRWIRGNHDSPEVCKAHPNWIQDGFFDGTTMFMGGAESIDAARRTMGVDMWPDEELSWSELHTMINQWEQNKPMIMVTHEAPRAIVLQLWRWCKQGSRTSSALDAMLDIHQPDLWIFGHHHTRVDQTIGRTRFICLEELGWIDL